VAARLSRLAGSGEALDTPVAETGQWFCLAWTGLILLLTGELLLLRLPYDAWADLPLEGFTARLLWLLQKGAVPTLATAVLVTISLRWNVVREEFHRIRQESTQRLISSRWLGLHLAMIVPLLWGTVAKEKGRLTSLTSWEAWLIAWAVMGFAAFLTWCFAVLPPRFWVRSLRRSWTPLMAGVVIGFSVFATTHWVQDPWWPLQRSTFEVAAFLLRLLGQQPAVRTGDLVIGTPRFSVSIGASCSGIEGIFLVVAVLAAYFWYFRRDLIFPQVLVLLPVGALAIWLLNSVRIAVLILLGNWSNETAIRGFHSVAGWLLVNLVACGLIWMSRRSAIFKRL